MRVLVTGGTGFVGAWIAKTVQDAGHAVRLLVRNPARLEHSAAALGVDTRDHVVGDIADLASVERALDGCDAVVHAAAVVSMDRTRAAEMQATNLAGAHHVLGTAVAAGLDPVVHVSSITALFRPGVDELRADLPIGTPRDGYGRSKALVESFARDLQDTGAPVVITYPGMVLGPGAGDQFGEVADGLETLLKLGILPGSDAAWTVVDVRDVGELHARLLEPGLGPRRYLCGGAHLNAAALTDLLRDLTGRRLLRVPVPGVALRTGGRLSDLVTRWIPLDTVFTQAAMEYYTQMPPSDDQPSVDELGLRYRDVRETFEDCLTALVTTGRLTAAQVGRS